MRGQVWSLDFVTSVIVFLIVFIPLFFIWSYLNVQNQQEMLIDDLETLTMSVSDSLVRTRGMPEGWDTSDVKQIGLAEEENVLNSTKVSHFLSMGTSEYNRTRAILTGGYDFFFNLTDVNGTQLGAIGSKPPDRMTIPIERYCLHSGRIVKLEFAIIF